MRGSEIIVDVLRSENVELMFGIPGAATLPLYDELLDSGIRHILVRHEQGAAHMADGYARIKRSPGICIATSGAGATNLVTGVATAYLDSSPVIAITGQVPTNVMGSDGFQEADIFSLMMPITKHNFRVTDPSTLATDLRSAFRISMSGRFGPVHIDIPKDVLTRENGVQPPPTSVDATRPGPRSDEALVAAKMLMAAERPLIMLGGGAKWSRAGTEALAIAEKLAAPIVTTLMGKGAVPETHPLVLGLVGMHGRAAANYALDNCDVLLAVGARFSDRTVGEAGSCNMKVIHVDIDRTELGKNICPTLGIVADAKAALSAINDLIDLKIHSSMWSKSSGDMMGRCDCDIDVCEDPISPRKVIFELNRILPQDAIIVTEVGQCQMWAAHFLEIRDQRTFVTSGGLGTMGFGLPAAIGAKFAAPDRKVIDIAGDGSFMMVCQELATASKENIPVAVVLMNNTRLGMIKQHQRIFYGNRLTAQDLSGVDMVKLAEAFGAEGIRVDDYRDLVPALETALESEGPVLVDIQINREEDIFPLTLRTAAGSTVYRGSCPYNGGC
ncbi:MAG TPA: biosynthetic-type acetolactate synthase large subunit [Candidatus Methanomethylophilaceae archaeon]|nr:biosynthetic-type acetolactate synthase large subunit [Candidatus Methanomethylophilaceae archaeon]